MIRRLRFFCDCVSWDPADVDALSDMIDRARQITRSTFVRHTDPASRRECEQANGYALDPRRGLTMNQDRCVTYYGSILCGRPVYFYTWSAIEHVFSEAAP